MTDSAVGALYKCIHARLLNAGIWGRGVYADLAPADARLPFVVYTLLGGGDSGRRVARQRAVLVVNVKIIADTMQAASEGEPALDRLLVDRGQFDLSDGYLTIGGWAICTTSRDQAIQMMELTPEGRRLYHSGFQLRVVMEEADA